MSHNSSVLPLSTQCGCTEHGHPRANAVSVLARMYMDSVANEMLLMQITGQVSEQIGCSHQDRWQARNRERLLAVASSYGAAGVLGCGFNGMNACRPAT